MGGIKQTQYTEGVNARRNGKLLIDNPYVPWSDDACDWAEGWHEANKTTDDCENGRNRNED